MARGNVIEFQKTLKEWADALPEEAADVQRRLALLILGAAIETPDGAIKRSTGLLQMTPVDTGHARGNWQMTAGAPATDEIEGGSSVRTGQPPTTGETLKAVGALRSHRIGESIFIANNVAYIVPLNLGHSKQIPPHWIEQAVNNALAIFRTT